MKKLECGHQAQPADIKMCRHIIGKTEVDFFRVLRGEKLKYDVCCSECAELVKSGESIEFVEACAECVQQVDNDQWEFRGWLGQPSIEEQLEPLDFAIETFVYPVALADSKAVFPLDNEKILAFDGSRIGIFTGQSYSPIINVEWTEIASDDGMNSLIPRFTVSKSGRYVALANDYGQRGQVFDLLEARLVMPLDRGDYCADTQPFPVAFFQKDERDLLVHGSDWNRLEISDPSNGQLLTIRDSMRYESKAERPAHYLDYFHGQLLISPDNQWVVDDGWLWHPLGDVVAWNLDDWLSKNLYESEDGESRKTLCYRVYLWSSPMCWITNSRVAIWGIGHDEAELLNGVRIFDVESGEEIIQFAGPSKNAFWSDGKRLFSNEIDGLHVWDVERGIRTGKIEGFRADFQRQDDFIEVRDNSVSVLTLRF